MYRRGESPDSDPELRASRKLSKSHGGRLWAADTYPRGASFCFTLPTKAETHE